MMVKKMELKLEGESGLIEPKTGRLGLCTLGGHFANYYSVKDYKQQGLVLLQVW
jgi:hypothetical protein